MQGSISSLLSQALGGHGPESQLFQAAAHLQPVPELGGGLEQQQSQERRHQLAESPLMGGTATLSILSSLSSWEL